MSEMAAPRDTFVLLRGAYDKPGDKVTPAVLSFLPPMPAGAPRNRLGLAGWLVDPANPLTARVAVNRYWQMYFGTGLVKTAEDFGSQGEAPSHPELLDWLATEFIRSGWDVKAMQRLIVTSAAYRQTSIAAPALRDRDPENRLLARGPRLRLPAEMIRDQALAGLGTAQHEDARPFREALSARGPLGAALGIPGPQTIRALHGRGPLAPQRVQLLEADRAAAFDDHLRRTDARGLRGAPPGEFHAPAGAGAAQ